MHRYTVVAVSRTRSGHALCLQAEGGLHLARATAAVPPVGATLLGNAPRLGFGLLLGAPIDQVFRVIFEALDCTQDQALRSLHGEASP